MRAMSELWQKTATELAAGYACGAFTPSEAVEDCLERLRAVEPQIEAFLDTAEGTSRFADELRAARDREPADDAPSGRGHLRAL